MTEDTMFLVVDGDGVNDWYKDVLDGIIERGEDVSPRGLPTKEIRPVMVIIKNPRERFLTCPGRLIHPYFQVMESIWILGGRGDLDFIEYYLGNMSKYADGKKEFHAPYGVRMRRSNTHRDEVFALGVRDQFWDCYVSLKKEPNTRQAVMTYWNPHFDSLRVKTNDRPCNIAFQFLIRNDKLDLTIFNRSTDITYGLANTNVVQFSVILETMAMLLGIPVGNQIHMINSLHAYDYQGDITKKVLGAKYGFNVYDHVKPLPFRMDLREKDRVQHLDFDLKLFFQIEKDIRQGKFESSAIVPSFNYLNDALILAKSFYYYKQKGNYIEAANELLGLQADDLLITCLEFVFRKFGVVDLDSDVQDVEIEIIERFSNKGISEDSINKILYYLRSH